MMIAVFKNKLTVLGLFIIIFGILLFPIDLVTQYDSRVCQVR